jgi:hypothetical protein
MDIKGRISVNGGNQNVQERPASPSADDSESSLAVYQQVNQYQPYVDENGNFRIPAVPEGRYRIQVNFADGPVANDGRGGVRGQRGRGAQQDPRLDSAAAARGENRLRLPVENPLNPATAFVESIRQGSANVYDNGTHGTPHSLPATSRFASGPGRVLSRALWSI